MSEYGMTATYSPEDNKLRLYAATRLDKPTYERVKAAGFHWAPRQDLFVAPMWTPSREDLLLELCGEIGDEDTSLVERQEQRAERFEEYSESRAADAEQARKAVHAIADNIPLGQPILVGHHSERHARKDAEKIENGMRRAVKMWETSQYWQDRAAGALRHAKYKELPAVRARRIKGLEADLRKQEKYSKQAAELTKAWEICAKNTGEKQREQALQISNYDHVSRCFTLAEFPREAPISQYEGAMSLWSALDHGIITPAQASEIAIRVHGRGNTHRARWIAHLTNRIEYEQAMLGEAGGLETDKTKPEKGGACRCWASPGRFNAGGGGWSYIVKVNRVSVSVLDNWGNGGPNFRRVMPFDKLKGVMSAAEVQEKRAAGLLIEASNKTGFFLADAPTPPEPPTEKQETTEASNAPAFNAMRESLRQGVKVVTAPQLFPTPADLAARMVEIADIEPGQEVLEPSAGTGAICEAITKAGGRFFAIEINHSLCENLSNRFTAPGELICKNVLQGDFLEQNGNLGKFDRILMNPPFSNGADIKHIKHALTMLKPGGRLVAICANGPRQNDALRPLASKWEVLPENTFKESGTGVNTVLLTIEG